MIEDAMNITSSKEFSESMSQLKRFSQNTDFSEGQDMGKRLSETLSTTFDQSDHLSKSMGQHLTASEAYSKAATYAKDNSARMDQNHTDQFWGWFEHQAGGTAKALELWNSRAPEPTAYRNQKMAEYQHIIEQQTMAHIDARVASKTGFYAATSNMAKHHDASVAKMDTPSREAFESKRDTLKGASELGSVDQQIKTSKESFVMGGENIEKNFKTGIESQKGSLKDGKAIIQKEYQNRDKEGLTGKAWNALWDTDKFNKKS